MGRTLCFLWTCLDVPDVPGRMRQNRVGIMPGTGERFIAYGHHKQQGHLPLWQVRSDGFKVISNPQWSWEAT
jgi:hypothetical protein